MADHNVVFVCLHGSAKSVIASAYFERLAAQRGLNARASAHGTEPDAAIPPRVVDGLLGDGIDVRGRRPRGVTSDDLKHASRVISFGCDLSGIAPAGLSVERWDDVPAVSEDYGKARDAIIERVTRVVASL
jgi:protein-tyrosine-phosphatase